MGDLELRFTCPACGFRTLPEAYGLYNICEVCGWEDDPVQLGDPSYGGGANRESLAEHQAAFVLSLRHRATEHKGFFRDPEWRPLSVSDVTNRVGSGPVTDPSGTYWRRQKCGES